MTNVAASVTVRPQGGLQSAAWSALIELAPHLGIEWTLIGGQMVFLHQAERQLQSPIAPRWSTDLDLAINLRAKPGELDRIHRILTDHGFVQPPQPIEHRYRRDHDGVTVDVVAPDHLGEHLPRLGVGHTTQAPGSTQALRRTEWVSVTLGDATAAIARPNLVGALILKQAAVRDSPGGRAPERHRHDVFTLAAMLQPDDSRGANLTRNERRLVRSALDDVRTFGSPDAPNVAARLQQLLDPSVDED